MLMSKIQSLLVLNCLSDIKQEYIPSLFHQAFYGLMSLFATLPCITSFSRESSIRRIIKIEIGVFPVIWKYKSWERICRLSKRHTWIFYSITIYPSTRGKEYWQDTANSFTSNFTIHASFQ